VKLLLDECVTRRLKREFANHEVHTVDEAGLKGLENGDLLKAASGKYEVLVTVDRNLPYQQNISGLDRYLGVDRQKKQLCAVETANAESADRVREFEGGRHYSD